jgi:AcrR family transcriptional regulator
MTLDPLRQQPVTDAAPRPYHHGDLRAALLLAAEAELADRGTEGFSLRSVAKRAGVSHAAPAHHFGDAQGLLTGLATEGFRRFLAAMQAREALATTPRDRAVAAGLGYLDFAQDRPTLFRLIFSSRKPDFDNAELSDASKAAYRHLVDLVEGLGGTISDSAALWAMAHGIADLTAGKRLDMLEGQDEAARLEMIKGLLVRVLPG